MLALKPWTTFELWTATCVLTFASGNVVYPSIPRLHESRGSSQLSCLEGEFSFPTPSKTLMTSLVGAL